MLSGNITEKKSLKDRTSQKEQKVGQKLHFSISHDPRIGFQPYFVRMKT
jgi:hypothetical protein